MKFVFSGQSICFSDESNDIYCLSTNCDPFPNISQWTYFLGICIDGTKAFSKRSELILEVDFNSLFFRSLFSGFCSVWKTRLVSIQSSLSTLCKTCPYSELFQSAFSHIRTEYGEIRSISQYSVRMRKNADQNNSKHVHFSRNGIFIK